MGFPDERGQRHLFVGPIAHGEVPGALAEEDEDDPEDQGQRRTLKFLPLPVVTEVHSALPRPVLHTHSKGRKRVLANGAVQSLVECDAEVTGLVSHGREPAIGQGRGRQQGQEREPLFPQEPDVHLEPFTRGRGRASIEQTEATALNQNPRSELLAPRSPRGRRPSGGRPWESTRARSRAFPLGVDQGDRSALVASEIPAPGELLDRVAEFPEDVLPGVARFDGADFLGGRLPSSSVTLEAVLEGVAGQESIDGQAVATDSGEVVGDAAGSRLRMAAP